MSLRSIRMAVFLSRSFSLGQLNRPESPRNRGGSPDAVPDQPGLPVAGGLEGDQVELRCDVVPVCPMSGGVGVERVVRG